MPSPGVRCPKQPAPVGSMPSCRWVTFTAATILFPSYAGSSTALNAISLSLSICLLLNIVKKNMSYFIITRTTTNTIIYIIFAVSGCRGPGASWLFETTHVAAWQVPDDARPTATADHAHHYEVYGVCVCLCVCVCVCVCVIDYFVACLFKHCPHILTCTLCCAFMDPYFSRLHATLSNAFFPPTGTSWKTMSET